MDARYGRGGETARGRLKEAVGAMR